MTAGEITVCCECGWEETVFGEPEARHALADHRGACRIRIAEWDAEARLAASRPSDGEVK